MSDTHVKAGTIILPPFGKVSFKIANEIKLAEEPELTKTEYFTPNHFDHKLSNSKTLFPFVNFGSSFKYSINSSKSLQ